MFSLAGGDLVAARILCFYGVTQARRAMQRQRLSTCGEDGACP